MKVFYSTEISRFLSDKKINTIIDKLHQKTNECRSRDFRPMCIRVLKNYGFVKQYTSSGSAVLFKNKKRKLIIKVGGVTSYSHCNTKKEVKYNTPKQAIPTIFSFLGSQKYIIRIQPLADVSEQSRKTAIEKLEKLAGVNSFDFHSHNVAMYRKKPVLIDW